MQIGIGLSLTAPAGGGLETAIRALFAAGEQGAWLDPSDLSSMSQDSAGTTPAAVGQPVGKINDKSGRGNHFTQATGASRPTLLQDASGFNYLSFDGSASFLSIAALDLSASDKLLMVAGLNKQSDATVGVVIETSIDAASSNGSFHMLAPNAAATPGYLVRARGTVASAASVSVGYAAPVASVVTGQFDIAGDSSILRINGTQAAATATDLGTGNFASQATYIGRRAGTSLPFNGRIYGMVLRGTASSAIQLAVSERYIASKMGIAL